MTGIAEGLFETHAATAPAVDLVVDLWILDEDRSFNRRDWLNCLVGSLPGILSLDLAVHLDVEMRLVLLAECHACVRRFHDPCFGGDLLHLFEEIASGSQQHNYYLIINLIAKLSICAGFA